MKNNITLWIDHSEAHLINLTNQGPIDVVILNENNFNPTKEQLKKFYHNVALELSDADQILLMGPGMAKEEFKNHCEAHHAQISQAIIKTETTESGFSAKQMIKASKDLYHP